MAEYVDGYVLAVPRKNLKKYQAMARKAGRIWREHGALDYRECVGEDLKTKWGVPFPKAAKARAGETVIFAFVVFKSRAHRDKVNAKVMKDPRLECSMDPKDIPFDCRRMIYGGFTTLVKE